MNIVVNVIIKNLLVNVFLVITKIVCGIIFNSKALVADGIHSLSDLITDFVSLFGEEVAKTKKGNKKVIFEDDTSLFIGIIISFLAIFMLFQAINPNSVSTSAIVIPISIFVIIVKFIIVAYVKKIGKKLNNSILLSSAEESTSDIVTSIIALIAIVLSMFSKYFEILKYADLIGGIIISFITLFVGINIITKNEKDRKKLENKNKKSISKN